MTSTFICAVELLKSFGLLPLFSFPRLLVVNFPSSLGSIVVVHTQKDFRGSGQSSFRAATGSAH